ncbi:MAG TPA: AgmX/PglI C-terminal domain-containing protein [Kofleriaceae bacterium]|jgi:hypothetical protein|nr:AgmX/PglI C-terminal domain-containing protein [Kofleriaceae bacterium]
MTPGNARSWLAALAAGVLFGLGCGGGQRADTTPPAAGGGEAQAGPAGQGGDAGDAVPPDKIDEINRQLSRKREMMSRCLSAAVDNKELPKNARGKVTVEIVISPSGAADSVKIVRANLESKMLDDCIIGHIKEIAFPQLPRSFETSYSYGFEAM